MKIVCPECNQKCELGDEYDGVTVECPRCGKEFVARKPVPLIVCPACQGRVSVMAEACPHCGHPILPEVLKQEPSQIVFSENHHPNRYLPFFYVDWKYLVLMVIMFILVGFWIYGDFRTTQAQADHVQEAYVACAVRMVDFCRERHIIGALRVGIRNDAELRKEISDKIKSKCPSCEDVPWEWWDTDFSSIRQETENSDIPFMWCRVHRNVLWMNGNINGYSSRSPDEFEKMIEECKQKASIKSK